MRVNEAIVRCYRKKIDENNEHGIWNRKKQKKL